MNGKGSILNHDLMINSEQHLEVNMQLIPTGKIKDSQDTVFDYAKVSKINKEGFKGFDVLC